MHDKNIFEGKWKQLKGSVKEKWGKLTDDEINMIEGKSEKLIGKLQEKYGYTMEKAKEELDKFMEEYD